MDKAKVPEPHALELFCSVNGAEKQRGHTKERGNFEGNPRGKVFQDVGAPFYGLLVGGFGTFFIFPYIGNNHPN